MPVRSISVVVESAAVVRGPRGTTAGIGGETWSRRLVVCFASSAELELRNRERTAVGRAQPGGMVDPARARTLLVGRGGVGGARLGNRSSGDNAIPHGGAATRSTSAGSAGERAAEHQPGDAFFFGRFVHTINNN